MRPVKTTGASCMVFAVADDRRDGQLSVGREVDAGGDRESYAKPVAAPVSGRIPFATVDCRGKGQAYGQ